MFQNKSLYFKLLAGFSFVAVITGLVGFLSFRNSNALTSNLKEVQHLSFPTLEAVEDMVSGILKMKSGFRTLAQSQIDRKEADFQLKQIQAARKIYGEAFKKYEILHRAPEEERLFQDFMKVFNDGRAKNDEMIQFASQYISGEVTEEEYRKKIYDLVMVTYRYVLNDAESTLSKLSDYVRKRYGKEIPDLAVIQAEKDTRVITIIASVGFILSLILGFFLARGISYPIASRNQALYTASGSVRSASEQISSTAQELASGASELASSVEEMTASLEELQSTLEFSSKNVGEAEQMMKNTLQGSKSVTEKMTQMQNAMNEISAQSSKIGKIIKVIDDIAFQTNILALNAAVEAARAGDAGKGFVVVAEQVKSLAGKSAEAAKETAEMIEKAILSIETGQSQGNEVVEYQNKAAEQADKVNVLLTEINAAAREQLKGINQIGKAVTQINDVVQTNASSSEELAASGEELSSHSEVLNDIVVQLNAIIKGKGRS